MVDFNEYIKLAYKKEAEDEAGANDSSNFEILLVSFDVSEWTYQNVNRVNKKKVQNIKYWCF